MPFHTRWVTSRSHKVRVNIGFVILLLLSLWVVIVVVAVLTAIKDSLLFDLLDKGMYPCVAPSNCRRRENSRGAIGGTMRSTGFPLAWDGKSKGTEESVKNKQEKIKRESQCAKLKNKTKTQYSSILCPKSDSARGRQNGNENLGVWGGSLAKRIRLAGLFAVLPLPSAQTSPLPLSPLVHFSPFRPPSNLPRLSHLFSFHFPFASSLPSCFSLLALSSDTLAPRLCRGGCFSACCLVSSTATPPLPSPLKSPQGYFVHRFVYQLTITPNSRLVCLHPSYCSILNFCFPWHAALVSTRCLVWLGSSGHKHLIIWSQTYATTHANTQ